MMYQLNAQSAPESPISHLCTFFLLNTLATTAATMIATIITSVVIKTTTFIGPRHHAGATHFLRCVFVFTGAFSSDWVGITPNIPPGCV
jgi:hypothetical protein